MKKHIYIMLCYFRLNLASALEYRASFLSQTFGMALSNSTFIFFWWIAFSQLEGTISGYSFHDILFIWAVTSSAYGLSNILFANTASLTRLIVTGELDTFLLQPCNILLNVLCARTNLSAYGDLVYGFVIMILFYPGNPTAWLWFLAASVTGALLMTAIFLSAHSLSFFFGNTAVLGQLVTEFLINFSVYPEKMYGPLLRTVMYTLIPVGFVVHLPLRLIAEFSPGKAVLLPVAVCIYCALSARLFYSGLRRYTSGNSIVTRL